MFWISSLFSALAEDAGRFSWRASWMLLLFWEEVFFLGFPLLYLDPVIFRISHERCARCFAQCNRSASFLGTPFSRLCTFNVDFKYLNGHMAIPKVLHAAAQPVRSFSVKREYRCSPVEAVIRQWFRMDIFCEKPRASSSERMITFISKLVMPSTPRVRVSLYCHRGR